jgi:hypothetical protein
MLARPNTTVRECGRTGEQVRLAPEASVRRISNTMGRSSRVAHETSAPKRRMSSHWHGQRVALSEEEDPSFACMREKGSSQRSSPAPAHPLRRGKSDPASGLALYPHSALLSARRRHAGPRRVRVGAVAALSNDEIHYGFPESEGGQRSYGIKCLPVGLPLARSDNDRLLWATSCP